MAPFVDRIEELASLDAALAEALSAERTFVVSIEGPCGIGKSALLNAFLSRAAERTRVAFVRSLRLERLATGTLEQDLRYDANVVGVDNAQWSNRPSNDLLLDALKGGRLRMLVLAFDDAPPTLRVRTDQRIVLGPLPDADIERIAGNPQIVRNAGGSPYEAGMLAKLNADAPSAARAIALFVSTLPAHARMLAHLLALIAAPVDMRLLRALVGDPREIESARAALKPLLREGNLIEFDHILTASAVAETIPMKIPLHRRIIAAIERTGVQSLHDRMLLVEQLLGSGDRTLARQHALDLAFESSREDARYAQLWASSRHLELGEPPNERFIEFYAQFFEVLNASGQFERAEAVASHALSEAQRRGVEGVVVLAAQVIQAQWAVDRQDAAHASFDRYAQAFTDPEDLTRLRAAAPWLRAS